MPNWCSCEVEIKGDREAIDKLLLNAKKDDKVFSLEKLFPMPDTETDWYNWNINNWGTKWDLSDVRIDDNGESVDLKFESAWSPPINAFEKISIDYPNIHFKMTYVEEGNDFFGINEFENGQISEQGSSYSEQFGLNTHFHFDEISLSEDSFSIPITFSYKTDPYNFDSEMTDVKVYFTIPNELDSDDIYGAIGGSITMSTEAEIDLEEFRIEKENFIANHIDENFELIKKAVEHAKLDKNLPVNNPTKNRNKI
jgi:hypothetical protein